MKSTKKMAIPHFNFFKCNLFDFVVPSSFIPFPILLPHSTQKRIEQEGKKREKERKKKVNKNSKSK